jgi:ADP-heptose:LPS heptosyltransferase
MNQNPQQQIPVKSAKDKAYFLILQGGMGARILQTAFIRSLIRKRKEDGNSYPILVCDNTLIGHMVSAAMTNQNVHGIQIPEGHGSYPNDPGLWNIGDAGLEHPSFTHWLEQFKNAKPQGHLDLWELLNNNWNRAYSIEYGFSLTKLIHQHKYKTGKNSFINNHYGKVMGLKYDGGPPMLKVTQQNNQVSSFMRSATKPVVVLHLGMDRNPQDYAQTINYRTFKVWSLQRWGELVDKLKHKYSFVQIYANQDNPEIPNVTSIKVDNLNPILQILEHDKCKFFMSVDNNLPHLAATIKKKGIVLWGSVSPNVWGHDHNTNIWNKTSCDIIGCWRPNMFDVNPNGQSWVCDRGYSCMKSITVQQVLKEVEKLEKTLKDNTTTNKITL